MFLLQSLRDPWIRLALAVWVVLVLMAVGRAGLAHHPRHGGSYGIYAQAGQDWLAGSDLYDRINPDSLVVFRYSPPVAALFVPLGVIPTIAGNGLLRLANLLVFAVGLWRWQRVALPATLTPRQKAAFYLVLAAVANNNLMDVQVNVLTAGLLLLTTAGAIAGRWWEAALSIGLAVALKGYPVSLALVLCVLAPRRFAWRWAVAQVGWFALPFLLQNPGYVIQQYRDWVEFGLNPRFAVGWFRDTMYLADLLGLHMTRSQYTWVELVAAVVVGVLCVLHHVRRPGAPDLTTAYALCVGWMLAFGPASETVTYILAAPAVAGAVILSWFRPNPLWFRTLVTVAALLLTGTQLELLFPGPHRIQLAGAHPLALLLFLIGVGIRGFGLDAAKDESLEEAAVPAKDRTHSQARREVSGGSLVAASAGEKPFLVSASLDHEQVTVMPGPTPPPCLLSPSIKPGGSVSQCSQTSQELQLWLCRNVCAPETPLTELLAALDRMGAAEKQAFNHTIAANFRSGFHDLQAELAQLIAIHGDATTAGDILNTDG